MVFSTFLCRAFTAHYLLTPVGKDVTFLQPQTVSADIALLKWGQPRWREHLGIVTK